MKEGNEHKLGKQRQDYVVAMIWSYMRNGWFSTNPIVNRSLFLLLTKHVIDTSFSEFHRFRPHCLIHSLPSSSNFSNGLRNELSTHFIHSNLIKKGSPQREVSYLLSLYMKSRLVGDARKLFDEIPQRDVRTWTVMISGFARNGCSRGALGLFSEMLEEGVVPNQFTFSSILKCCSSLNDLRMGKAIHGWLLRNGIDVDVALGNSILDLYVKCGVFHYAEGLFESVMEMDVVSWNIMIGAYLRIGEMEKSLDLFRRLPFKDVATWNTIIDGHARNGLEIAALNLLYQMVESGTLMNQITFSIALVLVSSLSVLELGRQIHGRILRIGIHNDGFVRNSLIDMYCKCGLMEKASEVFQGLALDSPTKQNSVIDCDERSAASVTWSSLVTGYIQNGRLEDAFKLFYTMVCKRIEMDIFTLTSIISACGNAGLLELGQQIHAHILKIGHKSDVFLGSSMIDMYAKCGRLDDAWSIFKLNNVRNIVLWTSIISSYASHGQGRKAIWLFELMLNEGIRPNEVTFVGVLTACSHAGLLKEGCKYFNLMKEGYGIKASVEHFTCMIDLFGRSGRLDMITDFIHKNDISHMSAVWKAFLSSCQVHKNIEMAKWVSEKLLELEPLESGPYILLSNNCATNQKWEEVAKLRALMKHRGVRKHPGQSWI